MKTEKILEKTLKFYNDVAIPQFGFGTYLIPEETGYEAVMTALEAGYRHIDTAEFYGNEKMIGKAIKDFLAKNPKISRKDLFITSKIWNDNNQYDKAKKSFDCILERLQLDYLDLCLLHWPTNDSLDCWKLLIDMYEAKKVRAIGVSNFTIDQIKALTKQSEFKPMMNQIEIHPGFNQDENVKYCQDNQILITSWRTMLGGKGDTIPLLVELADKYQTSPSLIALRWAWQLNEIVIPKSVNPNRIKNNTEIDCFELTADEINKINDLPQKRVGPTPNNYAWEKS